MCIVFALEEMHSIAVLSFLVYFGRDVAVGVDERDQPAPSSPASSSATAGFLPGVFCGQAPST